MKKKNRIIFTIKILLMFNVMLSIVFLFGLYKDLQIINNKTKFTKKKVLVDSIFSGISNDSYGSSTITLYYRPNGIITLKDSKSIFENKSDYEHFIKAYNSNNDSIYIWHHPKLNDLYAYKSDISVEQKVNRKEFYFSIICLSISILTVLFWKNIFPFHK